MKLIVKVVAIIVSAAACLSPAPRVNGYVGKSSFALQPIAASAVHHNYQAPRLRNKNGTSTNWSGYAVETSLAAPQNGAVTLVAGSWTVPAASASSSTNTYSSTWVGIDGYSDNTVEQIGTEQDWAAGKAVYYAWFEMYPKSGYKIVNFPVVPGDTISAQVQLVGKGSFQLTIKNVTRNVSFSTKQKSGSAKTQSGEWIAEAPSSGGRVLPLANFGVVNFYNCSAALKGVTGPIGSGAWQYDAINMATSTGVIKAQTSTLTSGGAAFSVTWLHE